MAEFGVIFDMDGVLVNSGKYIWQSFNQVLSKHGVHISDDEINQYLGLSLRDQIAAWEQKYGIRIDFDTFSRQTAEIQLRLIRQHETSDEGLIRLLEDLKSHAIPMGVGTSSTAGRAKEITHDILGIGSYFPFMVAAEDLARHKPNPDIFLAVAEQLGVPAGLCVVFEDAADGIKAAKAGEMKTVGVYRNDPFRKAEDLQNADLVISDFSSVSYTSLRGLF